MTEKELKKLVDKFEKQLMDDIRQIVREEVEKYFDERIPEFD